MLTWVLPENSSFDHVLNIYFYSRVLIVENKNHWIELINFGKNYINEIPHGILFDYLELLNIL